MKDAEFIENNVKVVEEFRANGGKIAGGAPLILITTKGTKTGQKRLYPLMAVPYDDSYLAVASKGGAPKHPQWYHNLMAHPGITVEAGTEKFPARARLLSGEERAKAFAKAAQVFPPYNEFQQKTAREIPVFLLKRVKEDACGLDPENGKSYEGRPQGSQPPTYTAPVPKWVMIRVVTAPGRHIGRRSR